MPQVVRFGCAGIAVIIIAALTSIGLYAVLTGGSPFGGPAPKPVSGGAQVLVTIQAGQPTPTPPSAATPTPPSAATPTPPRGQDAGPALPLAAPVAIAAPAPPTPTPTSTPTPSTVAATPTSPQPVGSPTTGSPARSPASPSGAARQQPVASQANHEGLTVTVVETERGWQPTDPAGAPIRVRDGHELVTVQVRLTNGAAEARYVADADFALTSDDGARFAARSSPPQREPRLLTLPLLAGDSARGWLTFELPVATPTRRIQWSPTRPDRPRAEATYYVELAP